MASAASATRDFRIPDRLTVQSVTECLEQYQLKWQQQLALQKKELFFWFHAETRGRDEAIDKSKARLAELEEETARLAAQSATLSAELETAEGKLAASETRAVAFETQCAQQSHEFESARATLTEQHQAALDAAAQRRMQIETHAAEALAAEVAEWERRLNEREAANVALRADFNALTEADYRKTQDIIRLQDELAGVQRDLAQTRDAAARHQADLQATIASLRRQLQAARQIAQRSMQQLFQQTERVRTDLLAEENASHALLAQSADGRHSLSRLANAGTADLDRLDSEDAAGSSAGVGVPGGRTSSMAQAATAARAPSGTGRELLASSSSKSLLAVGGGHGGAVAGAVVDTSAGSENGNSSGNANTNANANDGALGRAAMARRAAEHVRQLQQEAFDAVDAVEALRQELRDANAERDADARTCDALRAEIELLRARHADEVRRAREEWEQARVTAERQRQHEAAMAAENVDRVKRSLEENDARLRAVAESEAKLQAESYGLRSMHRTYYDQIEHYKKAATALQAQLKTREDESWQQKLELERVTAQCKNLTTSVKQLRVSLENSESRNAEATERRARDEASFQQRIATLERSLLASVNEVHQKARDYKLLQKRIEDLTQKVEDSVHATEALASAPMLHPQPQPAYNYPPFAYTQQQLQALGQTGGGAGAGQQQQMPYFLPPLSPAPPSLQAEMFQFSPYISSMGAGGGGGGGGGVAGAGARANGVSPSTSPQKRRPLSTVREEESSSYRGLADQYHNYRAAQSSGTGDGNGNDGSESERGRGARRRSAANASLAAASAHGGASYATSAPPPLAPARAFQPVPPPNQGPPPASDSAPSSARSRIPVPRVAPGVASMIPQRKK